MEKFWADISTTYFWVAVVLVGIVINLTSNWIWVGLLRAYSLLPTWLRRIADKRVADRDRFVDMYLRHPDLREPAHASATRLGLLVAVGLLLLISAVSFTALVLAAFPAGVPANSIGVSVRVALLGVVVLGILGGLAAAALLDVFLRQHLLLKTAYERLVQEAARDAVR